MESITEHRLSSANDTARFMVGYPADSVLGAAQLHFARDWPDKGRVQRKVATVEFRGDGGAGRRRERRRRRLVRLLGTVILGMLTLGLYPVGRRLLARHKSAGYWAEVFCREEEGGTLVLVSAGRERYMRLLRMWVKEELGGQSVSDSLPGQPHVIRYPGIVRSDSDSSAKSSSAAPDASREIDRDV